MKYLSYIILLLLPGLLPAASKSKMLVIGGPPAVTTNDSVYGSHAGANWDTYLNKNQKTFGAWNPNTGKSAINRLVGASYSNVTRSGNTVTVADAWPGVNYAITFSNGGWEEHGTIASAAGMTFQVYRATDLPNVHVDGDTIFYNTAETAYITPMRAWDANGVELGVVQTVVSLGVQQGLPTWRVTYAINTAGVVYPVTFDPSAILTGISNRWGYLKGSNVTYNTVHGASLAAVRDATAVYWGQEPGFDIWRAYVTLDVSSVLSLTADSAKVVVPSLGYGRVTTNFNWGIIASKTDTLDVTKFDQLVGFGATFDNMVKFAPFVNTAAVPDSVIFKLNAAGLDSLNNDGRFSFVIISAEDSAASAPAANERMQQNTGQSPYLIFYYTQTDGISTVTALDSTRIIVTFDSTGSGVASGDTLQLTYSSAGDTVKATGYTLIGTNGLTDTVTVPYADSNYTVQARHSHTSGGYYTYLNNTGTVRTRAANTAPRMGGWSRKALFFVPQQGINNTWTHLAYKVTTSGFSDRWLTTTGDTVATADTLWNKFSVWDALSGDSLFSKPWFTTYVTVTPYAKNGDSLVAGPGAALTDSLFVPPTITMTFLDSTRLIYTIGTTYGPSWANTVDAFVAGTLAVADSAVTDTFTVTRGTAYTDTTPTGGNSRRLTPNSLLAAIGVLILNPRDSLLASTSADSIFTRPLDDFTLSIVQLTDTSFHFVVDIGNNPPYTEWTLIDTALFNAGSTKVYYDTGATAVLRTTPRWFSGDMTDTMIWQRGTGLPGEDSAKVRLLWQSGF